MRRVLNWDERLTLVEWYLDRCGLQAPRPKRSRTHARSDT